MAPQKTRRFGRLVKTVAANAADKLEPYETPNVWYEFSMRIRNDGELPQSYQLLRVLAMGSKILRDLTRERES